MKLVVGAPVCDRDWALPHWFECLARQTRPPDEYVFVVKDLHGQTRRRLLDLSPVPVPQLSYAIDTTRFIPRAERNMHPAKHVYGDFADRRNTLRRMVLKREPDVFLSLDTDVMLEDEDAIERLLRMIDGDELPELATPTVYLHPGGEASECFNVAWWAAGDPGSPDRAWRRATAEDAARGAQFVDIPMAAVMMRREVLDCCRYRFHAQGEDLGFAQDLDRLGFKCEWNPSITTRHVMSEEAL